MQLPPVLPFGLMHSFSVLPAEFLFVHCLGFFVPPLCHVYGSYIYIYIYISRSEYVKKFEPCDFKMTETDRPREVCTRSVTKVEVAGQTQLRASMAYLNSSSHTTWSGDRKGNQLIRDPAHVHMNDFLFKQCDLNASFIWRFKLSPANLTWNLFSGLSICT